MSVKYSISALKYFSEQILVALSWNTLNILVVVSEGKQFLQECGLICTFVRAGWQIHISHCYFLMSRKFKHFSSFLSSMVNRMCLSCLSKIFWNLRDCSLGLNCSWVSSTYRLYVFGARFKLMLLQWHCVSNFERNF